MRFKKGTKVEVLSKIGVPSGCWRCAEIIYGNGHTYTVRYDGPESAINETAKKIPRKAIRPCPPLLEIMDNWAIGDIVEVFDDFTWKMATISAVLGKEYFLARIHDSSFEFKVSRFGIRTRQSWQDKKWIVIGKGSSNCEDAKRDVNPTLKRKRNTKNNGQTTDTRLKDGSLPKRNKEKLNESKTVSSRTLKRGAYGYKQFETYDGAAQKLRAGEKEGRLYRLVATNEQVDDVACPKEMVGEKFICSSFDNENCFAETDAERRKQSGVVGCSSAVELESSDEVNVTSSVGSCNIVTRSNYYTMHSARLMEDTNDSCGDAESFCHHGYEEGNNCFPTDEELDNEVHRLELHAYRCTMEALYASGPLSWEQEELVTNLRLSLHISNDEHLMEGQVEGLCASLPSQC